MNPQDPRQEIRRALLADPRRTSPAIEAAIAADPSLAALRQQLTAGAGQLATAFADVAPPAGLADRLILRVRYRQRSKWVAGIAASLMLAAVMLHSGTPDDVRGYCKKIIDTIGKDGGFIMDTGVMLDEAKPENLKAMFDFTREYGVYR